MGLFDRLRALFAKKGTAPNESDEPALITVYDGYGRQYQITRADWETSVLPGSIEKAHDDAEGLYSVIAGALQDGFSRQLLDASRRLLEIDTDRERSHVVRGFVLLKAGDLAGAETILSNYVKQYGPTGSVLTNLAKVYASKGLQVQADATLWQAVQLDPNQENGLLWWATLQRERGGDQAFWDAMTKAAALAGSWRPQLWLARRCLEQKQLTTAKAYYQQILDDAADETDVWMMISGDLGNNGYLPEMIDLMLPHYHAEKHGPLAGLNLLQACLETRRLPEGEELLHALFALNRPDLKDRLFQYSGEFDKLRAALSEPKSAAEDEVSVRVVPVVWPIWASGLRDPGWLIPSAANREDKVAFISLANISPSELERPTAHREDDLGRLTRSLPLYLLESTYFWTRLQPTMALPVVTGGGPVVSAQEWPDEHVLTFAEDCPLAVSGTVEQHHAELRIKLAIWDCSKRQIARRFQYTTTWESLGATVLRLEKEVIGSLAAGSLRTSSCQAYYQRPDPATMPSYLNCLGQTLMLSLVQNEVVSRSNLWGERNILQYCLGLALQMPTQVAKIMFLSAVAKNHDYGSSVYDEFKREALQLLSDEQDRGSPVYRLSPLLYRIFDPELFHLRKAELLKDAPAEYREWLEGITVG